MSVLHALAPAPSRFLPTGIIGIPGVQEGDDGSSSGGVSGGASAEGWSAITGEWWFALLVLLVGLVLLVAVSIVFWLLVFKVFLGSKLRALASIGTLVALFATGVLTPGGIWDWVNEQYGQNPVFTLLFIVAFAGPLLLVFFGLGSVGSIGGGASGGGVTCGGCGTRLPSATSPHACLG